MPTSPLSSWIAAARWSSGPAVLRASPVRLAIESLRSLMLTSSELIRVTLAPTSLSTSARSPAASPASCWSESMASTTSPTKALLACVPADAPVSAVAVDVIASSRADMPDSAPVAPR